MTTKGIVRFIKARAARACVCVVSAFVGCAVASASASGYTPAPFSNYQPIIDRMPFGAVPANLDQTAEAAPTVTDAQVQAEQQKLAQQINMSCINVTPDGSTAIGFTDLAAKPPVNYYLLVGASAGGWTVVKADYDNDWAQIEKDGVAITLKLGKGLIDNPPAASALAKNPAAPGPPSALQPAVPAPAQPEAAPAPVPTGAILRPSARSALAPAAGIPPAQMAELLKTREEITKLKETGGDVGSYMERLRERKRQEAEAKAAAEQGARDKLQDLARKITQEELAKKEREMNLSLIEQGAKPISNIALTPEEEQALIDKGVLAQ